MVCNVADMENDSRPPVSERRQPDRLRVPPCQHCGREGHVTVATRTDYVVYGRCSRCARVWSVPIPHKLLGT